MSRHGQGWKVGRQSELYVGQSDVAIRPSPRFFVPYSSYWKNFNELTPRNLREEYLTERWDTTRQVSQSLGQLRISPKRYCHCPSETTGTTS